MGIVVEVRRVIDECLFKFDVWVELEVIVDRIVGVVLVKLWVYIILCNDELRKLIVF